MRLLHGSSRAFPWFALLFALFWNAMVALMLSTDLRPARGVSPIVVYLAAGAFVLVGLLLAGWFVKALLRHLRFRGVTLLLDHPAGPGGAVAGSVTVPIRFDPAHRYHVVLKATEHAAHRAGGKLHTTMRTLFEEQGTVRAEPAAGGTRLRFNLPLPPEAPPSERYGESLVWTSSTVDRVYLQWHLLFSADVPGIDLEEAFEVNVLRSAPPVAAKAPLAPAPAPRAPLPAGHNPAFQYERAGDRLRIAQPAWKKPGNIGSAWNIFLGVGTGLLFAGIGVFILGEGAWVVGGVFFAVGALCVVGVLGWLAHELAVEVDGEGVRIVRRIGPFVFKDVRLYRAQIAAIEAAAESQAQHHGGSTLTRSVRVRERDGSTHTVAEIMPRAQDAVALRNLIAARLALGAEARVGSATVAPPAPRVTKAPASFKWAGGIVVLAVVAYQAWPFVRTMFFPERPRAQPQLAAAGPEATNVGAGYPAQYVRVTGKDFRAEAHGADLHVRIGEIRLEPTGKLAPVRYNALGVAVMRRADGRHQEAGSAWDRELRGELRSQAQVLKDHAVVVRGGAAHCGKGNCEAVIYLLVETGPNAAYTESTGAAALPVSATREIAAPLEGPPKYWDTHLNRASAAVQEGRVAEGMRLFDETIAFVRTNFGAEHPIEAYVLVRKAAMHQRQKDTAGREQALLRALAILERHPAPEAKRAIGAGGTWMDKEMVARELGDLYWDAYRYADGLAYYQRAYAAVPELDTTDYSRNLKLASSSAGIMATACVLGKWDIADRAMAELKSRYPDVRPEAQRRLKYWIDTGEPRLKARKC